MLLFPFYSWRNWGSGWLNTLPKSQNRNWNPGALSLIAQTLFIVERAAGNSSRKNSRNQRKKQTELHASCTRHPLSTQEPTASAFSPRWAPYSQIPSPSSGKGGLIGGEPQQSRNTEHEKFTTSPISLAPQTYTHASACRLSMASYWAQGLKWIRPCLRKIGCVTRIKYLCGLKCQVLFWVLGSCWVAGRAIFHTLHSAWAH